MTRLDKIVTRFGKNRLNVKKRFNDYMDTLTTKYPEYFHWTAYIPVAFFIMFLRYFGVKLDLVVLLQFIAITIQMSSLIIAISYNVPIKYRLKRNEKR